MCPLPDQAPGTPSKEPCSETNHHNIPIANQGSGARITTLLEGKPHHTQNHASLHAWRLFQKQESLIFHHVILIRSPSSAHQPGIPALAVQNTTGINVLLISTCFLGERLAERLWQVTPKLQCSITVPSLWEKRRERETRSAGFQGHVATPGGRTP